MSSNSLDPDIYNETNLNRLYEKMIDRPTVDGSTYRGILYSINTEELSFIINKPVLERSCTKIVIPPYHKKLLIPRHDFYKLECIEIELPLKTYEEAQKEAHTKEEISEEIHEIKSPSETESNSQELNSSLKNKDSKIVPEITQTLSNYTPSPFPISGQVPTVTSLPPSGSPYPMYPIATPVATPYINGQYIDPSIPIIPPQLPGPSYMPGIPPLSLPQQSMALPIPIPHGNQIPQVYPVPNEVQYSPIPSPQDVQNPSSGSQKRDTYPQIHIESEENTTVEESIHSQEDQIKQSSKTVVSPSFLHKNKSQRRKSSSSQESSSYSNTKESIPVSFSSNSLSYPQGIVYSQIPTFQSNQIPMTLAPQSLYYPPPYTSLPSPNPM